MSKDNKTNEYSVVNWSFFRFLLVNWRIWLTLISIISFFFFVGKLLHEEDFFGESLVEQKKYDITIKATRSTPNTSILILNPLEPYKTYEIDLGVGCKLIPEITNTTYNMNVQLFKRNYNDTYYLKLPEVKELICYTKDGKVPEKARMARITKDAPENLNSVPAQTENTTKVNENKEIKNNDALKLPSQLDAV